MENKTLNGYHTFYSHPGTRLSQYWPVNALGQLASVLFWKHNFGPMHLYCDEQHLNSLRLYGIDKLYDSIDTELITNIPVQDERYWSFAKIFIANEIAKKGDPFCIIDTDLWLKHVPPTWKPEADLQCLHREAFDMNCGHNPYVNPSLFLSTDRRDELDLNWNTLPLNAAVTYLNNPKLVQTWYDLCMGIVLANADKPAMGHSREVVFLEQWLLACLAEKQGLQVEVLLPTVYNSHFDMHNPDGTPAWEPPLKSNSLLAACEDCIRHIWGLKKGWDNVDTRTMVVNAIRRDITEVLGPEVLADYQRIFDDINSL